MSSESDSESARALKRIVFVDDEQGVLDGLRRVLRPQRREWEMFFACGVDTALEVLERESIDAVVSDVNMPQRDGFELLALVRADPRWSHVPVVILTGNGETGLKRKALDLGATDLLGKPVDPDDLVARMRSVLRLKEAQDEIKAYSEALEAKVRERTAALEYAQVELVWRLGKAGEFRDSDTGFHVARVGYYSHELAGGLGLDPHESRKIFLTSPLHDIGKIGIPDSILLKPARLTSDEWVTMRRHTTMGAQILREEFIARQQLVRLGRLLVQDLDVVSNNPFTEMAAQIAEAHHERWDGTGYPRGLSGSEIPIAARITTVADVYDALASARPYKRALGESEVIEIIRRGIGKQFDPEVMSAFEKSVSKFREIRHEFNDAEHDGPQADVMSEVDSLKMAG
jgi:response regulator RpfG family c-di-GMP phosphodiesterase